MRRSARRTPSRTSWEEEEDYIPAVPTGSVQDAHHDAEGDAALDELLAASGDDCARRFSPKTPASPWQGDETDAVLDKVLRCCVQRPLVMPALDTCACCRNAARRLRFLHDRMELDRVCEQSSVLRCLLTM